MTQVFTAADIESTVREYFNGDELAANVWITKYALKNKDGLLLEKTPADMHKRLASEFARIEKQYDEKSGKSAGLSFDRIFKRLDKFRQIVPQGSPMYGIGNNNVNVSLSNCVVVPSPEDNMSSILEQAKAIANLQKRRCGVGIDLSKLRPDGMRVNNSAGTTTGAWSFADLYSYICRMIGQNGRRGALMITLDVRHPDIFNFIKMKRDKTKVTGANVSVKITNDFMRAVEKDEDFELKFPVDSDKPLISKKYKAREIWEEIIDSATHTAEPGLLMWDNIINNLPAHEYKEEGFETTSTNPCGELPLSGGDSCRLISINLKHLVKKPFTDEAFFDFNEFEGVVADAMRLSDDLVELEIEKLKNIISICDQKDEKRVWKKLLKSAIDGRRTGIGTHGLADALARLGVVYGSPGSVEIIDKIYYWLKINSYEASVELAKERGAFPVFNWEKEKYNAFIRSLPTSLREKIKKYGRRNISILTNAPTGSVSVLSQTSSGIEPVYRNSYTRRKKLNHSEQDIIPDFIDDLGDKWQEYEVYHHNVLDWREALLGASTDDLPHVFITSDEIDWFQRIDVQAAIQKHIDHSISSTINLPKDTKPGIVADLYLEGWRRGLKGLTVYVDGSRDNVLVTKKDEAADAEFPQTRAPRRAEELPCDINHTTIKGEKWVILVGLFHGKPYEVLGGLTEHVEIPKKFEKGILRKRKFKTQNNKYDLRVGENGSEFIIKDVVKLFDNPNHAVLTRIISLGLRHGAGIQYVVEQLQKDKDSDMFSFAKCVARVLKKYIQDGTSCGSDKGCPTCEAEGSLVYKEGCVACMQCGWTKCM